jgi:TonB family protein
MNRLQKKCIVASSAFHGLLVGILLFGAALMPSPDEKAFKPLTVYSADAVSAALSSGGSPDARVVPTPPAPTPPNPQPEIPPTPKPQAQPIKQEVQPPEPPKPPRETPKKQVERAEPPKTEKVPKPKKLKPEPKEVVEASKQPHKIVLDKTTSKMAVRKSDDREKMAQEAAANAAADARRKAVREVASAYRNISQNLSSSTVFMEPGNGQPGVLSVNYRDLIASKYYNAWVAPADLDDATPIVTASVTIDRNGNVKSARIITPSGNHSMDRSILRVLDTVTFFEPFPASIKEQEMTVTVKFNVLAKRGTG